MQSGLVVSYGLTQLTCIEGCNTIEDWEAYEDAIYQRFRERWPDSTIKKNVRLAGHHSKVSRQVDILVQAEVTGMPMSIAVECKCFSRKVDVKDVEAFISMMEDLQVAAGVMITNQGYSQAAKSRAFGTHQGRLRLDVLTLDELQTYRFDWWVTCELCDPGSEGPPTVVEFYSNDHYKHDRKDPSFEVGVCGYCNGVHIRCQTCGEVTGVYETEYGRPKECQGGCGGWFMVDPADADGGCERVRRLSPDEVADYE